jgi:hypothetical protein
MISLRLLLEDIKDFRASLNDKRFNPFTAEEWNQAVAIMNDPNADDREKEQIKQTTILKNLRLIPMWWLQGWKSKFTYIDDDQYQDIAVDKAMNLINGFSFERGTKYGALLKRSIFNELINQNRKNEKIQKRTTSLDTTSSGKDGSEMDRYDSLEKSMVKEPELSKFMNDPEFADRVNKLKSGLSRNQKFVMSWILHPNFADIKIADIVKAYNDNLPQGERPLTNQTLNQAKYVVMDMLLNDPVIKRIIED